MRFWREAPGLEGGGKSGADDRRALQAAVLYDVPTYSVCREHGYLAGEQKDLS